MRRQSVIGLLVTAITLCTSAAKAEEYGVEVVRNVRVPMRDGVHLSTDVYLPLANGRPVEEKLPAVLIRTAYNKKGFESRGRFFARHGYLSLTQDVRGRFASEGEFYPFVNEPEDGYDTMVWLAKHPRSNGKVGTYGCSYMAWVQFAMASLKPPGLAAMLVDGIAINTYHHAAYPRGARQLGLVRWVIDDVWPRSHEAQKRPEVRKAIQSTNLLKMVSQFPWERGTTSLRFSPRHQKIAFDYLENREYNDYWKQRGHGFDEYFESFPDIPILWESGWYDGYPRSIFQGYRKMVALGRGKNQWVICGPWIHNGFGRRSCAEVDFGPAAGLSRLGTHLAWFDHWLKGDATSDIGPHIQAFLMGGGPGTRTEKGLLQHGGKWYSGDTWPPATMRPAPFYLHAGGGLSAEPPQETHSSTSYLHDPRDPVPSMIFPWTFRGHPSKGPRNQVERTKLLGKGRPGRPLAERPDVVSFETPPLHKPVQVLGPVTVRLWIASDGPDTDFTAKLVDVYPPNDDYPKGFALGICEGLLPARTAQRCAKLRTARTRQEVPAGDRIVPRRQPVCQGASHPAGCGQQQLPPLRDQPQHGRPDCQGLAGSKEHALSRLGTRFGRDSAASGRHAKHRQEKTR